MSFASAIAHRCGSRAKQSGTGGRIQIRLIPNHLGNCFKPRSIVVGDFSKVELISNRGCLTHRIYCVSAWGSLTPRSFCTDFQPGRRICKAILLGFLTPLVIALEFRFLCLSGPSAVCDQLIYPPHRSGVHWREHPRKLCGLSYGTCVPGIYRPKLSRRFYQVTQER